MTPDMFAEYRQIPAWIPYTFADHGKERSLLWDCANLKWLRRGYKWQPSTDYTGAGWVRPRGRPA